MGFINKFTLFKNGLATENFQSVYLRKPLDIKGINWEQIAFIFINK